MSLEKILAGQSQDIDYMKTQLGNQTGTGSGISDFMFRKETITISIGSANLLSRGLGSSFILGHPSGLGWLGSTAGSIAAGSQPYLGDSRGAFVLQNSGVSMVVVDDGVAQIRNWLGGQTVTAPTYIGIGSDATTATVTDTSLGSEFESDNRYGFDSVSSGVGFVEFEAIIPSTSPSEQPTFIREFGVFDSNTVNTGSMYNHNTFIGFNKTSDVELQAVLRFNISGL